MKVVPFQVILPHATHSGIDEASALLQELIATAAAKRTEIGTPEGAIRGLTVSLRETGVNDDLSKMTTCWVIEGQIRVNDDAPAPDPRDDRWGYYLAFGVLRLKYGDSIPGKMRIFQTGQMFRVKTHKRQLEADRTELESPSTDGCDGNRPPVVAAHERTLDQPTTSASV